MNLIVNIFFLLITAFSSFGIQYPVPNCGMEMTEKHSCCENESKQNHQPCEAACCLQNIVDVRIKEISTLSTKQVIVNTQLNVVANNFKVFNTHSIAYKIADNRFKQTTVTIKIAKFSTESKQSWLI